jgi:hypothetical protein
MHRNASQKEGSMNITIIHTPTSSGDFPHAAHRRCDHVVFL